MKIVIYTLLLSIFSLDYLFNKIGVVNRYVALVPDLISVIAIIMIAFQISFKKRLFIHPKYIILFLFFFVHIMGSILLNSVQPGALFAGFRDYFRYIPFFLLPAVYDFSDDEIKTQLKFILCIALFQFPVTLYQRFIQYAGVKSGDDITGTLIVSSELSIFLISTIALLFAFFLKKRISTFSLLFILFFLFFPTTLNETKGTLVLLPLAIVVPTIVLSIIQKNFSTLIPVTIVCGILVSVFISLYNLSLGTRDTQRSLNSFFLEGKFKSYLYKQAEGKVQETEKDIGRLDSIFLALKTLSDDTTKLFLGLGIGNVSPSFSEKVAGQYTYEYAHMLPQRTAASMLIWEMGLIGLTLFIVWFIFVFFDSVHTARTDSIAGAISLGWTAVVLIYILALAYKNYLTWNSLGYSFWYFSGYVAAKRYWLDNITDSFIHKNELVTKLSTKIERP